MKAMKSMIMKNRESGSSNGACKFMTLLARCYKKETYFKTKSIAKGLDGDKMNSVIERGSIISLHGYEGYYPVFEVWRAANDKNFWPSAVNDKSKWPISQAVAKAKSCRVGLRNLQGFNGNNDILYIDYKDDDEEMVQNVMNAGNIYRMLKDTSIQHICSLYGKVDV